MHPPTREMSCVVQLGNLVASWSAEGVAWSPDVADDMGARCVSMMKEILAEAAMYGLLETDSEVMFDDGELAETGVDDDGE